MNEFVDEVMFLPLAVSSPTEFGALDSGMLARRLPDFVHQILNRGQHGPTSILEVQSPPEDGDVHWVVHNEPPGADEAFGMLPDDSVARAVVTGALEPLDGGLMVRFIVHFAIENEDAPPTELAGALSHDDPATGLLQLARRLARVLELPYEEPPRGLVSRSGVAFYDFLRGLDGATLLIGDLGVTRPADPYQLVLPFERALQVDPAFGLALRVLHSTLAIGVGEGRFGLDFCLPVIDRCLQHSPLDGEGCVAIAEHLKEQGDARRAQTWLQHAARLDVPPPRGLESLGILFANSGETVAARDLWLRGIELDGHPDFFAHLMRLYFREGSELDGWDMALRGLRRLHERALRADEWEEHDRNAGVLLHYLGDHLQEMPCPPDVLDGLIDLCELLDNEDRIDLGLCLYRAGNHPLAKAEIAAGLQSDAVELERRDAAVRALLAMQFKGFERRFSKIAEQAAFGRHPSAALKDLATWYKAQPEFWPALFFGAVARQRLGQPEVALDLLAEALDLSPGQPDVLHRMASLFDARGNPKRALELIDEALQERKDDSRLLAAKVEFLLRLDRREVAREVLKEAVQLRVDERELQRMRKLVG